MKIKNCIIIFFGILLFTDCNKKSDTEMLNDESVITSKNWNLKKFTYTSFKTNEVSDFYSILPNCMKDDLLKFGKDNYVYSIVNKDTCTGIGVKDEVIANWELNVTSKSIIFHFYNSPSGHLESRTKNYRISNDTLIFNYISGETKDSSFLVEEVYVQGFLN